MTNAELNRILDARYTDQGPFYVGFISGDGFTAIDDANDTMAAHPGWAEFTDYAGDRPEWVPGGVAAGQEISNPGLAIVTTNAAGSVVGVFLCTDNTKGGAAGDMVRPRRISPTVEFTSGKNLRVLITIPIRREG
jgi:hypothetical protein